MPYIGNPIYQSAFVVDQFSGNGSTVAFTMSVAPAGVTNVLVAVSGVLQDPSTYGVVGNTITFSAAPPSGTGNISCRYLGVPASGVTTTAYRTVTEFTATASQTTFTPPSYTVGFINVYLNGVLLGSADYTATNGTTVVLATGASAGNLVTVESFLVSSVLNAIPNTAGSVSSANIANDVTINFADGSASTPSITNNGDTNTGIFFPAADTIAFTEGGTEAMRLDSSGNMGIGTTSPGGYKLAVGDGSSNRGRIMLKGATSGNYPEINIDDTMNASGKNYQIFSTGGHLKVQNQTDAAVSFVANAFGIGLADNAPVDGDGIRFPATQSASSNANTLDDYEEGTWTPSLAAAGGTLSVTYGATRSGTYTKIGNVVSIRLGLRIASHSGGSGDYTITGLPFSASTPGGDHLGVSTAAFENMPIGSTEQLIQVIDNGSTSLRLLRAQNNSGWSGYTPGSSMQIFTSFTYSV
jgi:hypothetical protein